VLRIPLLLLLLVAAAHSSASAQLDSRVKVGARVRVQRPDAQIVGRIAAVRGDSVVVDRGDPAAEMAVSLRDVTELAVYVPAKGAATTAKVFGTIGVLSGGALYLGWCLRNREECMDIETVDTDPYDDEVPMSLIATVSLGFGALGVMLGQSLAPWEWQIVDVPLRVGLAPSPRGMAAYVSIPAPRLLRVIR
jgi:hypothetical protein